MVGICDCSLKKIPYRSRQGAKGELRTMLHQKTASPNVGRLNVYACGIYWHIGHRPNKRNQRRLVKRIKRQRDE